ncbi:Secondary metabolism regulator LAE1 [Colletotrichum spinosum]|uniref:Secondary metabolism regulator LAE1 n=1 Tax=Colletotrichum spinosum TaxID=1347390 RepID=A0A4R8QAT2_9PEZI|nr:Secondary metabolism regulator LAE1 [Colletotrichum spinosum]
MSENNPTSTDTRAGEIPAATAPQAPTTATTTVLIDADDVTDDSASELGDSVASSSTSVSSSIREYREENGRTYHKYKDGKYNIPNDERENDRLDLQHNLCLLTFDNKLGLAPPNEPDSVVKRVLDVGTGTGIWAIDFAEDHPDAEVLGFDLSSSMPDFVPPNVKFEIDDLEEEWTWTEPFDYIHSRFMNSSIPDWKEYALKAFNHLAPGGYFEIQDLNLFLQSDDNTLKSDHPLALCMTLMYEASVIFGRPFQDLSALKKVFEDVGFLDVEMHIYKWPTNTWPKLAKYQELGVWNNANIGGGIEALSMAPLTRALGWTKEEVQVLLAGVRKDLNNRSIHAYWPIYCIFGRKPLESKDVE